MDMFLVRHADAGKRADWEADDALRPLSEAGLQQARGLVERLGPYRPRRLLSSPHVRCVQTLEPLANALLVTIEQRPGLAEGRTPQAVELFHSLLAEPTGHGFVLCSHGDVVDTLLSLLKDEYGLDLGPAPRAQKGSTWHISVKAAHPVRATYFPPAIDALSRLDPGHSRQD
jgi:8-oxo-dGTP diphosphatase